MRPRNGTPCYTATHPMKHKQHGQSLSTTFAIKHIILTDAYTAFEAARFLVF